MEFIDGHSVAELIEERGALPMQMALGFARQGLEALEHIHERNIVHRDVKPSNILIAKGAPDNQRAILMDFGLVKAFDSQLTRTGRVLGTPRYIAPEMLYQGTVDHRSDVFQLGVILYEMVTGLHAFKGTTRAEVARNCLTAQPERPSLLNPEVDINLENLIYNALEKDPDERYATASEMLADFDGLEEGRKIYRRHVRRGREKSMKIPVIEVVEADDPSLFTLLDQAAASGSALYRWTWFLIPLLFLPLLLYPLLQTSVAPTVKGLHAEVQVDEATITWQSDNPYETAIQIGESKRSMSVVSARQLGVTKNHRVHLPSLKEDTEYIFQVVFPDGSTSDDSAFVTQSFKISDVQAAYLRGRVDIRWKTNVPTKGIVKYGVPGSPRVIEEEGYNVIHRQLVEVASPILDSHYRIIVRTEDGKEKSSERHVVVSPLELARRLGVEIEKTDVTGFLSKLSRTPAAKARDRRRVRSWVEGRLSTLPFRLALREFAPVADFFYGAQQVPVGKKIELYQSLVHVRDIDAILCGFGVSPLTGVGTVLRTGHALVEDSNFKSVGVVTWPVSIPTTGGWRFDPDARSSPKYRAEGLRDETAFPLLLLNASHFARAEVRMSLECFTHDVRFDLTINGRMTLSFHNLQSDYRGERIDLAHAFDPSLLHDGQNSFKLTLRSISGSGSASTVYLHSLTLAFVSGRN